MKEFFGNVWLIALGLPLLFILISGFLKTLIKKERSLEHWCRGVDLALAAVT